MNLNPYRAGESVSRAGAGDVRSAGNPSDGAPPTRARFVVAGWLCSMAILLYLDRICWAKSAGHIQREFGLSNTQLSLLLIAFQSAYAIFEIPGGRWGDRFGARRVITRITVWWSVFTALTAAAWGFSTLFLVRFLFGAGEAGALPNAARVLSNWFPATERGRVQGFSLGSTLVGGALAPILTAWITQLWGWRATFIIFGGVGILWALAFWAWFRDSPAEHGWVNASELDHIRRGGGTISARVHDPIPWKWVLSNRGIYFLSAIMFATAFNTYFYFSWFPKYLEDAHAQSNLQSGYLSSVPLWAAAVGVFVGGWVADRMLRTSSSTVHSRRSVCSTAMGLAALAMFMAIRSTSAWDITVRLAISSFCLHLTIPSWWSAAIEQSGKHVGPLIGLMNMVGIIGGMMSQGFVGVFVDWQKSQGLTGRTQWDPIFGVYLVGLLLACGLWLFYQKQPWEEHEG